MRWFRRLWAAPEEGNPAGDRTMSAWEPFRQAIRVTVTVPSADEYLRFSVTMRVEGRWTGPGQAPHALLDVARAGITHRAEVVSREYTLTTTERLRSELNRVLLTWQDVDETGVQARAVCEHADADPALVDAVAERERAVGMATVRAWQRQQPSYHVEQECALIRDPLRGTARWIVENPGRPDDAVQVARQLTTLRDLLAPATDERPESPGRLLDELLDGTEEACRDRLATTLRKLFVEYGRPDLADRLPSGPEGGA
ncbi:hypothetical protein [Saccharomonospora saliphila]|uniref:hypothetical protein n=1 Tax=Saccharomonospora saliphila TaxID=369829 RepID=UPI00036E9B15|nr:hypothetical protein [Saccharomonospora saliphila]